MYYIGTSCNTSVCPVIHLGHPVNTSVCPVIHLGHPVGPCTNTTCVYCTCIYIFIAG